VNAAHNDYLQLLVEYGVAGAVLAVIFIAIAYRRVGHLAKHWSDSWPHAVSYAALLGTVGILVHSLTDFNLQIPANAAIFYVMCMVASHSPAETKVEAADEC
jgi:O-antigen ligase